MNKAFGIAALVISIVCIFIPVLGPWITIIVGALAVLSFGPGFALGISSIIINLINIYFLSPSVWVAMGTNALARDLGHASLPVGTILFVAQAIAITFLVVLSGKQKVPSGRRPNQGKHANSDISQTSGEYPPVRRTAITCHDSDSPPEIPLVFQSVAAAGAVPSPRLEPIALTTTSDKAVGLMQEIWEPAKGKLKNTKDKFLSRPNWPVFLGGIFVAALIGFLGFNLYQARKEADRLRLQSANQAAFSQSQIERLEAERNAQTELARQQGQARAAAEQQAAMRESARIRQEEQGATNTAPSYLPSSNPVALGSVAPPAIHVGDRYTYETVDSADSRLNNITTREIIDVARGIVTQRNVNTKNGYTRIIRYDGNWNVVASGTPAGDDSVFNPPLKYFDFPLSVGKTWESHAIETNPKNGQTRSHTLKAKVEAREAVTVPAGTFDTLKILLSIESVGADKHLTGTDTSWYAPSARRTVRSELVTFDNGAGENTKRVIQLLNYDLR